MSNISFCHTAFKMCPLQRRQKTSTCRTGLTLYHEQTTTDVSEASLMLTHSEGKTAISHGDLFLLFQVRFPFNLRIIHSFIKSYPAYLQISKNNIYNN